MLPLLDINYYKSRYKVAIRDNWFIDEIEISDVIERDGKIIIYFFYSTTGTRKFCSYENIGNILFHNEDEALIYLEKQRKKIEESKPHFKYVIYDTKHKLYLGVFKDDHNPQFVSKIKDAFYFDDITNAREVAKQYKTWVIITIYKTDIL